MQLFRLEFGPKFQMSDFSDMIALKNDSTEALIRIVMSVSCALSSGRNQVTNIDCF